MWIGFDQVHDTETFHGSDAEYTTMTGLHERNARHTRDLMAEASRMGAILPAPSEQFGGTTGPTQFDVIDLPPIPRATTEAASAVGSRVFRLAS